MTISKQQLGIFIFSIGALGCKSKWGSSAESAIRYMLDNNFESRICTHHYDSNFLRNSSFNPILHLMLECYLE